MRLNFPLPNMSLKRPKLFAARASVALAIPIWIAACGGTEVGSAPRELTNFQAASVVIGQSNFESGQANQGYAPSASGFAAPFGLALTPTGGLLVSDNENNRVLFYGSIPTESGAAADAVLGQPDFRSTLASVSRNGMSDPFGVAVGAGKMAVAEWDSNRVLIYDRIPEPGEPLPEPTAVLGQPDFESSLPSCGPRGLRRPQGVVISPEGKLIVGDVGNNRILVWNSIPAAGTFATPPDLVLGQGDLDHCTFHDEDQDGFVDREGALVVLRASARMVTPRGVWTDGKRLVVSEESSHRVLIWNTFPTSNFQPADVVLGYSTFTAIECNDAPPVDGVCARPTASTLGHPFGVHSDGVSLVVTDTYNNRILIWNKFPQSNGQPADVVLGQPDFVNATIRVTVDGLPDAPAQINAQVLYRPMGVLLTPDALIASDVRHNRVLVFRR